MYSCEYVGHETWQTGLVIVFVQRSGPLVAIRKGTGEPRCTPEVGWDVPFRSSLLFSPLSHPNPALSGGTYPLIWMELPTRLPDHVHPVCSNSQTVMPAGPSQDAGGVGVSRLGAISRQPDGPNRHFGSGGYRRHGRCQQTWCCSLQGCNCLISIRCGFELAQAVRVVQRLHHWLHGQPRGNDLLLRDSTPPV